MTGRPEKNFDENSGSHFHSERRVPKRVSVEIARGSVRGARQQVWEQNQSRRKLFNEENLRQEKVDARYSIKSHGGECGRKLREQGQLAVLSFIINEL